LGELVVCETEFVESRFKFVHRLDELLFPFTEIALCPFDY
jgi:hypothetical protein